MVVEGHDFGGRAQFNIIKLPAWICEYLIHITLLIVGFHQLMKNVSNLLHLPLNDGILVHFLTTLLGSLTVLLEYIAVFSVC